MWIRSGAVLMLLAVACGAFGAHALKGRLDEDMRAVWETAVRYHVYHALALFVVAWLETRFPNRTVAVAGWCLLTGTLVFSGSLYALALSGIRVLGAVTPFGGLLLLAGWLALAAGPLTPKASSKLFGF